MKSVSRLGSVYRCPVCGAEVSVIRRGSGCLEPFCCNVPMELADTVNPISRCTMCGTEAMTIKKGEGKLEPFCCDNLMIAINV